ncbi:MAG: DUF885 domain-containing protein [Lysobacterales bacterium]
MSIDGSAVLAGIAERLWQYRLGREPALQLRSGGKVSQIPADTLEHAEQKAAFGSGLLRELNGISKPDLTNDDLLTFECLQFECERAVRAPEDWWIQFSVTPYSAMSLGVFLRQIFHEFSFSEREDAERYAALLHDYSALLLSLKAKLDCLSERRWLIPKPAIGGVLIMLRGLKSSLGQRMLPCPERLAVLGPAASGWRQKVERWISGEIEPAFDELMASLGTDYASRAPEAIGLSHLPQGDAAFRARILHHLTIALEPERIHATGLEEVQRLNDEMEAVRSSLGFSRKEKGFHEHLRDSGRYHASSAEEVEQRYRYHMGRMDQVVGLYFSAHPHAPHDVARLDLALEPGLSYGYYETPTASRPSGTYRYNGSGLDTRSQINSAALIFHELVPGHHFHLARQAENRELPDFRRENIENYAFMEGWAEYASALAQEMGLYDDPYDWYGRLVQERFSAQRLVVDTGLNALGWTLEQAQAFMRANTLESDTQIASEILRYATDLPAQALTYGLGYLTFRSLRQTTEAALGAHFDVCKYHEAILAPGALPFPVLEQHLQRFVESQQT